jgi:tRNA pseudouridine38-40 synthase
MGTRTKLTVAYLGGGFRGWQRQAEGRTVQGELEKAVRSLSGDRQIAVVGAGRTDAGVHASAQVAHLDLPVAVPPEALPKVLNARLARDVRVRSARSVPESFHARKDARGKLYVYRIKWRESHLPWRGQRSAVQPPIDDHDALVAACRLLTGRHDWSSFTVPEVARRGAVRTIFRVEPRWRGNGLDIHFLGEGFLRYQVRRMTGALLEVGRRRLTPDDLVRLLTSPTPGATLMTAPPEGLTLEHVHYRAAPSLTVGDRGEHPVR